MARKIIRRILIGLFTLVVVAIIVAFVAYRASQAVPAFYRRVLVVAPEDSQLADDLERNVLELRNDVHKPGAWEAEFSDAQINSWLATELPKNFPRALPPGVSDPRVAVEDGRVHFACRFKGKKLQTVVSLRLDVSVTERPNVLMVRVDGARAGWLPIPFKRFMEDVTRIARDAGVGLRWTDEEGDPVALVTLPEVHESGTRFRIEVDTIQVGDGKVVCYGRTLDDSSLARLSE